VNNGETNSLNSNQEPRSSTYLSDTRLIWRCMYDLSFLDNTSQILWLWVQHQLEIIRTAKSCKKCILSRCKTRDRYYTADVSVIQ
jgi:hypothetical protein